jgi:hypothetical protein
MERSVPVAARLIGIVHILGSLGWFLTGAFVAFMGLVGRIESSSFIQLDRSVVVLVGVLFMAFAAPWLICGVGLCTGRPWARPLGIVLALVSCGLALTGGNVIWVLVHGAVGAYLALNQDVARAFR